jgi:hypothetical protein
MEAQLFRIISEFLQQSHYKEETHQIPMETIFSSEQKNGGQYETQVSCMAHLSRTRIVLPADAGSRGEWGRRLATCWPNWRNDESAACGRDCFVCWNRFACIDIGCF